jgi:hypothetical protein
MSVAAITFEDIDEAFTATALPVELWVRIGDVAVDATEASVSFGVDRAVGTCTVYVQAPRPATAEMNATIEVEMGYPGASARRFLGVIPSDESVLDDRGKLVRIEGVDYTSRLAYPEYAGIEIEGPVSLKDAFRSLAELRGLTYLSDETTATDGLTEIMLGGNTLVNEGHIRIDNRTDPLSWLQRIPPAYGYRVFGCPDGSTRQARVSGLASPEFTEGDLTISLSQYDYVKARTSAPLRDAPDADGTVIDFFAEDDIGRLVGSAITAADGFDWMEFYFPDIGRGWASLATGGGTPYFYQMIPATDPPIYEEGVNCFRIQHERSLRDMATYIEVKGARYTDEDGGTTEIRAIPDEVPYAAELDPPGYRKYTVSLQDIVTDEQAQWVREATEVDRAAPFELISWEAPGRADLQPGDVVTLVAPTHDIEATDYWLMSIDESVDSRGYIGRYSAWRGAGEALEAGNDCRSESVGGGVIHAGTQTLSHYRDTSPDSVRDPRESDQDVEDRRWVVEIAITVTDADYSSLRLTGICHGTNSIGNRTAITGSKVEVWQLEDPSEAESGSNEERRVGTMDLPTANEEYSRRRNYATTDRYWTPFSLPMPGTLKEGAATLVIVCGESDPEDSDDDPEVDDFELDDLVLTYCGVGEPALPGSVEA